MRIKQKVGVCEGGSGALGAVAVALARCSWGPGRLPQLPMGRSSPLQPKGTQEPVQVD